ncbi:MAG: class I SAM-dependent methyltransferase [Chitinophagales bacterium]
MKQQEQVKDFFDGHAPNYKQKYAKTDTYYDYFFYERLETATQNFSFAKKSILDIGTGTGALYDYISRQTNENFDFVGTDISPKMIAQSRIPPQNRKVGNCYELDYEQKYFDFMFMLGVTTYINDDELAQNLAFIHQKMSVDSRAIITFTNSKSLDNTVRNALKSLLKIFASKERVIVQDFTIYSYLLKDAEHLLSKDFEIEKVIFLNHTIFPFSRLMPSFSVKVAKWIGKSLKNKKVLNSLSSDFMFVLKKK